MTDTPTIYTAHDVPDLINALPTLFGFTPTESLVAVATYGERRRMGFRLRVDIPPARDVRAMASLVVRHLKHQDAEGAILIAVSEHQETAAALLTEIERVLAPVDRVVSIRATASLYWTTEPEFPEDGIPYERSAHHLSVVQAVAAGQEILPDRQALVARFKAVDGARRRRLEQATEDAVKQIFPLVARCAEADLGRLGIKHVGPIVERGLDGRLEDHDLVRLSVWISSIHVRDAVWARITRENAVDMLALFTAISAGVVPPFEAAVLSLAAFAAWLSGDGAQALIAAERALAADRNYSMARAIMQLLEGGVSPAHWRGFTTVTHPSL